MTRKKDRSQHMGIKTQPSKLDLEMGTTREWDY